MKVTPGLVLLAAVGGVLIWSAVHGAGVLATIRDHLAGPTGGA
jgi:hypothetical protein